jgi:HEAT repeat protein
MTKRRALWLVVTILTLAAFSVLIPASPAYLPTLVSEGFFGRYHDGHSVGYWTDSLKSNDVELRRHAGFALGSIGADAGEAVPVLATVMLEDSDTETRCQAALALSKMVPASRSAVPALARALQDDEPFVRMNAATALFRLRGSSQPAVPALIAGFKAPQNNVRLPLFRVTIQEMMALALGRASVGSADGVAVLKETLEVGAPPTRLRFIVARALGFIGAAAGPAVPQLTVLLKDDDPDVREAAREAIFKIEGKPTPEFRETPARAVQEVPD